MICLTVTMMGLLFASLHLGKGGIFTKDFVNVSNTSSEDVHILDIVKKPLIDDTNRNISRIYPYRLVNVAKLKNHPSIL
ncbi:unnamed protein product [Gordionus sp. m RMFG-2023]